MEKKIIDKLVENVNAMGIKTDSLKELTIQTSQLDPVKKRDSTEFEEYDIYITEIRCIIMYRIKPIIEMLKSKLNKEGE